jgi:ABC-type nitrate/sulfonate/bicarbonate transport system ATPase subunit
VTHIELRNVAKRFGAVTAVDGVSLEIASGEFLCLLGASGCGKTTLLRIINGLTEQSGGRVVFNDVELTGVSRDMGFVFQDINLLPWRNVRENVEIGLEARRMPAARRRLRALEALQMVGLEEVADVPPYTLSGGMQQRVGVARALAIHPKVLLMDEPFGQLDNFTRETLQIEISKLWSKLGTTIVFVTHDVDEAIFLSDRIALFQGHPGRLTRIVDVDLPHPRWEFNVRGHPRAIEMRESIIEYLGIRDEVRV